MDALLTKVDKNEIDINALLDAIRTEPPEKRTKIIEGLMNIIRMFSTDPSTNNIVEEFITQIFNESPTGENASNDKDDDNKGSGSIVGKIVLSAT